MILSLATGWPLPVIRAMPDKDYQVYRRFYAKCPFGPARGDMQAWLTAANFAAAWAGTMKPMHESLLWFGKAKRKAKPKKRRGLTAADMKAWVQRCGGTVIEKAKE